MSGEDATAIRCRIGGVAGPRPSVSLRVELANTGAAAWSGVVLEPAIPWDLRAWAGGRELAVRQPALDVMSRARPVRLEPGEAVELRCPIVLVLDGEGDDPFAWQLVVAEGERPQELELAGSVALAGGGRVAGERTRVALA